MSAGAVYAWRNRIARRFGLTIVATVCLLMSGAGLAGLAPAYASAGPPGDYGEIRSVTVYSPTDAVGTPAFIADLHSELPAVKAAGFNTVWLVTPWVRFDPQPFATPHQYNEAAFANLRDSLDVIRSFGMRAFVSPQYFGSGWEPNGIDINTWLSDPRQFQAFETFTLQFLSELQGYGDMLYVNFFSEGTMHVGPTCTLLTNYQSSSVIDNCPASGSNPVSYCAAPPSGQVPNNCLSLAAQHAALIRQTLGSLPEYVAAQNPSLRAEFRLGYHDGRYYLANLLVPASYDYSPVPANTGYDYLSMTNYEAEGGISWPMLSGMLDSQLKRYQLLYPTKPVVVGEFGTTMCAPSDPTRQAEIDSSAMFDFLSRGVGFNVWGWSAPTSDPCSGQSGLYLLNADQTERPALTAVANVLHGGSPLNPSEITVGPSTTGGQSTTATSTPAVGGRSVDTLGHAASADRRRRRSRPRSRHRRR